MFNPVLFKKKDRSQALHKHLSGFPKDCEPLLVGLWKQSGLPIEEFNQLYLPLLTLSNRMAISLRADQADEDFKALLFSIDRAVRVRQSLLLPEKADVEEIRAQANLYTYALVAAVALHWMHQLDSMSIPPEQMAWSAISAEGFQWIRSQRGVLDEWFKYLQGKQAGVFYDIMLKAGIVDQLSFPKKAGHTGSSDTDRANVDKDIKVEMSQGKSNKDSFRPGKQRKGWAFVARLKKALLVKEIPFNKPGAMVHVNRRGQTLLVNPQVFEWYESVAGVPANRARNQFIRLGIYEKRSDSKSLFIGSDNAKQPLLYKGFVVSDPNVLWNGTPPKSDFRIRR